MVALRQSLNLSAVASKKTKGKKALANGVVASDDEVENLVSASEGEETLPPSQRRAAAKPRPKPRLRGKATQQLHDSEKENEHGNDQDTEVEPDQEKTPRPKRSTATYKSPRKKVQLNGASHSDEEMTPEEDIAPASRNDEMATMGASQTAEPEVANFKSKRTRIRI
jgi:hypothetical protein